MTDKAMVVNVLVQVVTALLAMVKGKALALMSGADVATLLRAILSFMGKISSFAVKGSITRG